MFCCCSGLRSCCLASAAAPQLLPVPPLNLLHTWPPPDRVWRLGILYAALNNLGAAMSNPFFADLYDALGLRPAVDPATPGSIELWGYSVGRVKGLEPVAGGSSKDTLTYEMVSLWG